ncbi:Gfo/Idh/MocA family protein [Salinibacillus xinjiangensis]|uniref:Gfo/Idh/MocA family oxidoreductase n=1 Tax=Salinibacillus xinjiangensis TaxID=1229268 RepID=A0A6G1X1P1_9BACI|nr:Gfo/Idh/MocA family oxidoreductase [Salinibacillus xinjiangensis]MRG84806.1 gfo/Idh/MocA family oxidoreductase [Salinibacillus xinjiangensis]
METIKVGIIGCGSITRFRHAPEYYANPYVEEIVFYDRNLERSQALAKEFNGCVAETVDELLKDPSIVAISDCSSNETHHIITSKALLSGKHVLCEKPLAVSVEKAERMVEAQRKSGKKLMVDHNQRFTKAHQKARELIASKELGEVLTFKTSFGHQGPEHWGVNKSNSTWFFKKERSHSGVAGDLGIHKIDLIHYLLDDEVVDAHAFTGALDKVDENGEPIEVCDNVVSALRTKKGRIGTASFSWTYYGEEDNSTTIYCQKGIIKIYHHPEDQLIVETKDGEVVRYQLEPIQTNDNQTSTGVIDAFVESIIQDKEPLVSGADALSSLRVIEKILGE